MKTKTKSIKEFYKAHTPRMLEETKLPERIGKYLEAEHIFLSKAIKRDSVVLDVGCGLGRDLEFASRIAKKAIGIEYSPQLIRKIKERAGGGNLELIRADAENMPLPDSCVDMAMCMYNTIGNMRNPAKVIGEMSRVTKTNGILLLSLYSERFSVGERISFYKSCGLTIDKVQGNTVHTLDGFFSNVFSEEDMAGMLHRLGLLQFEVRKISEIGLMIKVKNSKKTSPTP